MKVYDEDGDELSEERMETETLNFWEGIFKMRTLRNQKLFFILKESQFSEGTQFEELTFCLRINLEYFRLLGTYSYILEMLDGGGWQNGEEVLMLHS